MRGTNMGIVEQLTEKPWLSPGTRSDAPQGTGDQPCAVLTGLRLYFAVITVMFALIAAAYIMHRTMGHAAAGQLNGVQPLPLGLLWLNSVVLGCSSIAWERARRAARRDGAAARSPLIVAGIAAVLFLIGQSAAWWRIANAGGLAAGSTAAFFYLISALHGLHLLGGLVAWARVLTRLADDDAGRLYLSVRLCADYWHFLLLLWLLMFALLVST